MFGCLTSHDTLLFKIYWKNWDGTGFVSTNVFGDLGNTFGNAFVFGVEFVGLCSLEWNEKLWEIICSVKRHFPDVGLSWSLTLIFTFFPVHTQSCARLVNRLSIQFLTVRFIVWTGIRVVLMGLSKGEAVVHWEWLGEQLIQGNSRFYGENSTSLTITIGCWYEIQQNEEQKRWIVCTVCSRIV